MYVFCAIPTEKEHFKYVLCQASQNTTKWYLQESEDPVAVEQFNIAF